MAVSEVPMPAPLIVEVLYQAFPNRKKGSAMSRRLPKRNPRTGRFERSGGRRRSRRRR